MAKIEKNKEGYRTAFNATALFGGVQVFTILVSLVRNKLVAVWLGPAGMGIMNMFNQTIDLIYSVTNLGLQNSAVRDIARTDEQADPTFFSKTVKAINRWVLATGLLGALITVALSPLLSRLIFQSGSYTLSFVILSCIVMMMGIYSGNYALLQGTRRLKYMAKANIFGALAGFVCSVPIFYFFREKGIVSAMVLTSLATLLVSFFFVRKVKLAQADQTWKESYRLGLGTMKLGVMLALSGISATLVQFIVRIFISYLGGEEGMQHVGLYYAGWAINWQYFGLVFTAIEKDYFPRLVSISSDNTAARKVINQQSEIAMLIIAPMVVVMIIFLPYVISLLYTSEYLGIVDMVKFMFVGTIFRAGVWAISFLFLAKGDGKTYLFNELGIRLVTLPSYALGYYFFGLTGVGYGFLFSNAVYLVIVVIVSRRKYGIGYGRLYWINFAILLVACMTFLLLDQCVTGRWNTVLDVVAATAICGYSVFELNKRINISGYLKSIAKRLRG